MNIMKRISIHDYRKDMGTLIDLSSQDGYAFSHPLDAINIPYQQFMLYYDQYLDKSKPYFLTCKKGIHSNQAVRILEYLGYAWRIFKFDKDMTYLVLADTLNDTSYVYDNRYNEIAKGNRGKNSFENSRIAGTLNGFYNSFFAGHHAYLKTMNACIHSRSLNDTIKDGSIECYTTYSTPIALLSVYDYMNASLDYYCLKSSDRNCSNYNYLAKTTNNFWLLNGTNEDTYKVYVASASMLGALQLEAANSKKYIRVVIALPNDIEYKSGIGTKDKPYTFYEY